MTISMIWQPVLDAAGDSGGNGGSRGRGGRRSSSIIAGRRPASRSRSGAASEAEEQSPAAEESTGDSEEERPRTPRRRRRTTTAKATAESESPEASSDDEEAEKPAAPRRRRSRAAEPEPEPEETPTAEAEADEPVAEAKTDEEPEAATETKTPTRRRTTRRAASSNGSSDGDGDVSDLRALVEEQGAILNEVRAGLLTLGGQLDRAAQKPRMGVFVDVPNLMYGQGPDEKPVNMGRLLEFLRQGRDIVRATAYSPVSDNPSEPLEQQKFVAPFVPYEYRIVTKPLKRFADGSIKGNFDVEMAIDMLTMADRLDIIAIVSGDADFARAVEVVQTRGVRVEVVAFAQSSSLEMRSLADRYVELGKVIDQLI